MRYFSKKAILNKNVLSHFLRSNPFFLRGVITACLKASGISPLSIERLTILVINGTSSDVHSFNSKVCIGSNMQDLDGENNRHWCKLWQIGWSKFMHIIFIKAFRGAKIVSNIVYFFNKKFAKLLCLFFLGLMLR